uniref:Uncharacterized protein n=1 Tax=Rhizophora mucronata TaxID=61149 RepID=A0A2P2MET6_RHIMU
MLPSSCCQFPKFMASSNYSLTFFFFSIFSFLSFNLPITFTFTRDLISCIRHPCLLQLSH